MTSVPTPRSGVRGPRTVGKGTIGYSWSCRILHSAAGGAYFFPSLGQPAGPWQPGAVYRQIWQAPLMAAIPWHSTTTTATRGTWGAVASF